MPIGVIINSLSILTGGIFGALAGHRFSPKFKADLTLVFGVCSMGMGISTIVLMEHMPAVIFSIILGSVIGLLLHVERWINKGALLLQKPITTLFKNQKSDLSEEDFLSTLVTIIVLFCASGTGIYGSLSAGMTQDHTILISKSILDFFTAAIFACSLGYVVSTICIPQFILFFLLFILAGVILPLTTPEMINDFKACGGFLILATGFRMTSIKNFPIADMIPAMILVMPISWIWTNFVMVLL